ncbi:MAG: hypothetical protein ACI8XM_000641 [Haloarculaceae archaeon]|jgi:hypothetical protein
MNLPFGPLRLSPTIGVGNAALLVFLVVGVFAGAHCLRMRGSLVSVYADRIRGTSGLSGRIGGVRTERVDVPHIPIPYDQPLA